MTQPTALILEKPWHSWNRETVDNSATHCRLCWNLVSWCIMARLSP